MVFENCSQTVAERKIALEGGLEASLKDDQVAIVGQDMKSVPADIGTYAKGVKKLDFSWNCLWCVALRRRAVAFASLVFARVESFFCNAPLFSPLAPGFSLLAFSRRTGHASRLCAARAALALRSPAVVVVSTLEHVEQFVELTSLVLDNNAFASAQSFPATFRSLDTLWVNNNNVRCLLPLSRVALGVDSKRQISSLDDFLNDVASKYPNLVYLSMLKNPACPNYFTGKDTCVLDAVLVLV